MTSFVSCKLIDFKTINILIFKHNIEDDYIFTLLESDIKKFKIIPTSKSKKEDYVLYEFKLDKEITLGFNYQISITNLGIFPLNVNALAQLEEFDNRFYYDGDDLGCRYSRKETRFALWAPLASQVILLLDNKKSYNMERSNKGVYRLIIKGNLKNHFYNYIVFNSGVSKKTIDPYATASTPNSKNSVILDLNSYKIKMNDKVPNKMHSYLDAIIYEGHIRDLTIDPNTNIKNKGKYLGLIEEGRVNKDGLPVGFDYIKSLGITHLQLLPIYDFYTTDENDPKNSYNWGYDPAQYFVPEGSYSSNVEDPSSRIRELLSLVSKFHSVGIRIVMDVVFNHVYEHQYSSLEACVPNYYFRKFKNGKYFNASGCGNDLATERKMTRKLIVDACKFWTSYYHVDGFRFDLMGLIDIDTINEIKKEVYKIKQDLIFYGEGWNMLSGYNLTLSNFTNYNCLPCVSFFNDSFRDTVIGNVSGMHKGYGLNNYDEHNSFKEVLTGSTFNVHGSSKFNHPSCSINFVECHDNHTLFDKITLLTKEPLNKKLNHINFINALTMYSLGIPFFHAGQEIGLSKKNNPNTYNAGDEYNFFNYSLLKDRKFMVDYFKELVAYRKKIRYFHEVNTSIIDKNAFIFDLNNNGIKFIFNSRINNDKFYSKVNILINPSDNIIKDKEITINPISVKLVINKQ